MTQNEELNKWAKDEQAWLAYQAPLRHTAYFDENATPEQKAEAERLLKESVAALSAKWPALKGEFHYTQTDVEEAKAHGF